MADTSIVILRNSDKKLIKQLTELGPRVAKKVLRRATNLSMAPVLKQARKDAPKESGLLKKNLTRKTKTLPSKHAVITMVGVKTMVPVPGNRKGAIYPHAYGVIQEEKKPYIEPALRDNEGVVIDKFKSELVGGMIAEALKMKAV